MIAGKAGQCKQRRELAARVVQPLVLASHADHEDRARPVTRADADVARARRAVEEVPGLQRTLLVLDDQQAGPGEDEEALLGVLAVVAP